VDSPPPALIRHLAALRHDLGKYVALQVRSLPPDPEPDELRAALVADLVRTRRGPDGVTDASAVFAALAPALRGEAPLSSGERVDLRGNADFDALAAAMARLEQAIPALREGGGCDLARAAADAIEASERCRALHRRLQLEAGGG
jgi:hypothetical protein